jgi:exoribonuclease R
MVHRLLQYYLDGGNQQMKKSMKLNVYILLQWKVATSAERDSIKYMQVKYMQDHKDQEFFRCNFRVTEWEFLSKLSKINVKVCVESEI